MRPRQIKWQSFIGRSHGFVTPVILRRFLPHSAAEDRQCIAMIAIATDDSARRITGAEENRERQYRGRPSETSCAISFIIQESRGLIGNQQAERRDDWEDSVDSFGRDQRHQDEPADAPTDQPKRPERRPPTAPRTCTVSFWLA